MKGFKNWNFQTFGYMYLEGLTHRAHVTYLPQWSCYHQYYYKFSWVTTLHPSIPKFWAKAWTLSIPKAFYQFSNDRNRSKHFKVMRVQRNSVTNSRGVVTPLPIIPELFTKLGPSRSRKLSHGVWTTKISQSVFELCERKEKVGPCMGPRVGNIQTRASTGLFVNQCTVAMSPKGAMCVAWHATLKHFCSVAHHFGAMGEICFNGHQTCTIRCYGIIITAWSVVTIILFWIDALKCIWQQILTYSPKNSHASS